MLVRYRSVMMSAFRDKFSRSRWLSAFRGTFSGSRSSLLSAFRWGSVTSGRKGTPRRSRRRRHRRRRRSRGCLARHPRTILHRFVHLVPTSTKTVLGTRGDRRCLRYQHH